MLYINDESVKLAFLTMMNKLIYSNKEILKPLYRKICHVYEKDRLLKINELETRINENADRKHILANLMAKGILDTAILNKENAALAMEEQTLWSEKEKLVVLDNKRVKELRKLVDFTAKSKMLKVFREETFIDFVERITVESRLTLVFHLKCGLNLKERLVKYE